MSNMTSQVISGVLIAVASACAVGGFTTYVDVQRLQDRTEALEMQMKGNKEVADKLIEVMNDIRVAIAVNTEAISNLKDAVRSGDTSRLAYLVYNQEVEQYDSGD